MLRGRRTELARIDAALDAARTGVSGALVVRGEAGIGKTTLLGHAVERAGELRVLRGTGVESEAELSFAGLHLLLRPALDGLDALPTMQRQALAGAFGMSDGEGDRFMIGAAVLSLLAEHAPVLCVVDDAHWLDRASADALLFAARRLDHEGVVVLFGARDHAGAFPAPGIPELRLAGLDETSAAEVLDDTGVELTASTRARLIAETRGNPLALRELPAVTTGAEPESEPLPVTQRVIDAFHHQVSTVPAACRTLLLLAAADTTGELPTVLRAAADLGATVADLAPAEQRRLIMVEDGTFTFRHPLIRAAVYRSAATGSRIAAHRALAGCTEDPDLRAWHRAAAALGPDEQVAAELDDAARRAAGRGGHAAAAETYERAARLSEDNAPAGTRMLLACEAATRAGRLEWARERAEKLLTQVSDPSTRLRLTHVCAAAHFGSGELARAHRMLIDGTALSTDPAEAFWMLIRALHAAWASPTDVTMITEAVDLLGTVGLAPDDPLADVAWLARWGTAQIMDRDTSTFPAIDDVLARARTAASTAGLRGLTEVASRALVAARDAESAEIATAVIEEARAKGMVIFLPAVLGHLTLAQVLLGRHREAKATGDECVRIATATDQPLWSSYAAGGLAYLGAIEGDEEAVRHFTDVVGSAGAGYAGASTGVVYAQSAQALLDLGRGRVQSAFDQLTAVVDGPVRHVSGVIRCMPDLVEAAVRLGRPDHAAEPIARYTRWAETMRQPWIDALLARCHALTAGDAAEEHFLRAIDLHDPAARPFELARTQLLYGEWLRRARRKAKAREYLTSALTAFEEIGSAPWITRARSELGAAGVAVERAEVPATLAELTPQEHQISLLAAKGLANKDIAAQLCLSPRTVAYHLYKAYPKLGIQSRGELTGLM
ncbi:ATP-binding protein [Pseudonocardia sp. TRM90224]|uniref:ATP-binding protein n=1 Tax=Pseudonocardia sp. TRM90224 TaxID=2812678 RepID=UPI001E60D1DB|nr:helix-turn-helix transcriptional regulator [Pseudonocardia sp. TRM90224]